MSNIKLVIVPAWLNLIAKELGITNDDLANCEKLSGILSPRDLLIYKIANFQATEILGRLLGDGAGDAHEVFRDFIPALPAPTLEERTQVGQLAVDNLIFGTTSERVKSQGFCVQVELTDSEVLAIRLISTPQAADSLREDTATVAAKMVRVLRGRLSLNEVAELGVFKRYVNEIQINSNLY